MTHCCPTFAICKTCGAATDGHVFAVCAVMYAPAVVCTKSQGTLSALTLNVVHPDLSVSRSIGVLDCLTDVPVHGQQLTRSLHHSVATE